MNDIAAKHTLAHSTTTVVMGALLSAAIAAALVIATAKAGISPGVSPLVVLLGWVLLRKAGERLHGTLALLQVTGSGGAAVSAGVIFTAPIIQVYARELGQEPPPVDVTNLIFASLSGCLLGWGFVGLATPRFLSDPRLPAPEAVACDRMINTAAENPNKRPAIGTSLILGLVVGTVVKGLEHFNWLKEKAGELVVPLPGALQEGFKLPLPASPLLLGIGALLTLPTALLVFGGALINAVTTAYSGENGYPADTFRWVGGAAMTVAVVWSLAQYVRDGMKERRRLAAAAAARNATGATEDPLLEIPATKRKILTGAIVAGAALFFWTLTQSAEVHLAAAEVSTTNVVISIGVVALVLVSLLSGLGALLSLQVGASASPVSGTVFMAMLVLSVTALGVSLTGSAAVFFLTPALVAACVAICAANDASQDYKTLQFNGYPVHRGFNGQLIGLCVGALVVPVVLAYGTGDAVLGSADYPCPQASFFGTALKSLFEPDSPIPWAPVGCGAVLGVGAVIMEIIGRRFGLLLSPLALAVGIYLPSELGMGILLGAGARFAAARTAAPSHGGILTAAGLISGYALLSLAVGLCISAGLDLSAVKAEQAVHQWFSVGTLVALLLLLFGNYLPRGARK